MRVWVGYHPRIGIVVFDPTYQAGVDQTQVRLWVVEKEELKMFARTKVRENLLSLKSHLMANHLEPLITAHGITSQIAKRYFKFRPSMPTQSRAEAYCGTAPSWDDYDDDGEMDLIRRDMREDENAWARSNEEGWYYEE